MVDTNFREELTRFREKVEDIYTYEGNKVPKKQFDQLKVHSIKVGRGTYGHVYKAMLKNPPSGMESRAFALKLIEGTTII
jgi:hypothetical protein